MVVMGEVAAAVEAAKVEAVVVPPAAVPTVRLSLKVLTRILMGV
jgi:hypothetical protein